jgi:hypothetical protein
MAIQTIRSSYLALVSAFVFALGGISNVNSLGSEKKKADLPKVRGSYKDSSGAHPNLFATNAEIIEIARKTKTSGTFSAHMFGSLRQRVRADLLSNTDWSATYAGCDLYTYLHLFSFEPLTGYSNETRSEQQLQSAARVKDEMAAPKGAAIVAARLALFASLVRAGAGTEEDRTTAKSAIEISKSILTRWAVAGFPRDDQGVSSSLDRFCVTGLPKTAAWSTIGLQISRGIIYFAFAQDLLQGLQEIGTETLRTLNTFELNMYSLISNAHNFKFERSAISLKDCERLGNSNGSELTALLSLARLLNDPQKFEAVLAGGNPNIQIALPWTTYLNLTVYGDGDRPNSCYPNSGPTGRLSHPSFETRTVVRGEINDRYRNSNPLQSIGYSMFTLENLYRSAEILVHAGYDPYGYRGLHDESLEASTELFACYGRSAGFSREVNASNATICPNFLQYDGKIVNGVERNILIGAYRFPENSAINDLNERAKSECAKMPVDPLLFGRWRD